MKRTNHVIKKALSLFLATMFVFSAFGISTVFAADNIIVMSSRNSTATTFTVTGANFGSGTQMVCVTSDTLISSNSINWDSWKSNVVNYSGTQNSSVITVDLSKFTAQELEKTYIIYARKNIGTNGATVYAYAQSEAFRLIPAAPVVIDKTDSTISLRKVDNCEYAKVLKGVAVTDADYQLSANFTGLASGTEYDIYIRYGRYTTEIGISAPSKITVKTYMSPPDKPAKPVFVSCNKSTIVVKEVAGVEFSIDNGVKWQTSGTFSKLDKSTTYNIIARGIFVDGQLKGEISEVLQVRTASRNVYDASISDCKVVLSTTQAMVGEAFTVTATGDWSKDTAETLEGDTRFYPISVETSGGGNGSWSSTFSESRSANITPDAATDELKVTVTFQKQEYSDGTWKNVNTSALTETTSVRGAYVWYEYILIGLNVALQLAIKGLSYFFSMIGNFFA